MGCPRALMDLGGGLHSTECNSIYCFIVVLKSDNWCFQFIQIQNITFGQFHSLFEAKLLSQEQQM